MNTWKAALLWSGCVTETPSNPSLYPAILNTVQDLQVTYTWFFRPIKLINPPVVYKILVSLARPPSHNNPTWYNRSRTKRKQKKEEKNNRIQERNTEKKLYQLKLLWVLIYHLQVWKTVKRNETKRNRHTIVVLLCPCGVPPSFRFLSILLLLQRPSSFPSALLYPSPLLVLLRGEENTPARARSVTEPRWTRSRTSAI